MSLTDVKCKNAKVAARPYKVYDEKGLYLSVSAKASSGKPTRLWRYKFRLNGREGLYAIGEYPGTSLAEARLARDAARALVKQGINPVHERQAAKAHRSITSANTFEAIAREWTEELKSSWAPVRHHRVVRTLEKEVFNAFGSLPIRDVKPAHVLALLKKIEKRGAPASALLVKQLCGSVFRRAVATLRADTDPTAPLRNAVRRPRIKHHAPIPTSLLPSINEVFDGYGGDPITVAALKLLLLTFVRPGEMRGAEWSEFDLDTALWRIPAARMKMREIHVVPLSSQALEILHALHALTGRGKYLFPNRRRPETFMASTSLNRAIVNLGFKGQFSAHGFRATASTLLNEQGYRTDLIERQLGHAERNKVRASYNQAEYLPERVKMMQAWADYLDSLQKGRNVVAGNFGRVA